MPFIVTEHLESKTFPSVSALLNHLTALERVASSSQMIQKMVWRVDGVGSGERDTVFSFLLSKERTLVFAIELQGVEEKDVHDKMAYTSFVQSQRLNELRLLPRAREFTAAPQRLRRAKVSLVRGLELGLAHVSFQHQHQQQQQMMVQAKRSEPRILRSSENEDPTQPEADLGELITAENIEEKLGEFWRGLSHPGPRSVLEAWHQIIGVYAVERMSLNYPMAQFVQFNAMKMLLSHFPVFMGGVVAHDLPDGFFWMKNPRHSDAWVLCFDADKGHLYRSAPVNALTVCCQDLEETPMKLDWHGIVWLRKFRDVTVDEVSLTTRLNKEGPLYNVEEGKFSTLLLELSDTVTPDILSYCQHQVIRLSGQLIKEDWLGLMYALMTHGVTGVAVLLSHFETLINMAEQDALVLFRAVYLRTPDCYVLLLQEDNLLAFDGFKQLAHQDLRWWWHSLKTQPALAALRRPDFKQDINAYRYFLKEVQAVMGKSNLPWDYPETPFPSQPLQVTWNRALAILKRAVYSEEQFTRLSTLRFDQWGAYCAAYQNDYGLVAGAMALRPQGVFNGNYRVSRLSSFIDDAEFDVYFNRYIGMQQWRAGSWDDYVSMKVMIQEWLKEVQLPTAHHARTLEVLFACLTTGKKAFDSIHAFDQSIKNALSTLTRFKQYHYDLADVMQAFSTYLPQIETCASEGFITLPDVTRALSLWLLISGDSIPHLQCINLFLSLFIEYRQNIWVLFDTIALRQAWNKEHPETPEFSWKRWESLRNHVSHTTLSDDEKLLCHQFIVLLSERETEEATNDEKFQTFLGVLGKKTPQQRKELLERLTHLEWSRTGCIFTMDVLDKLSEELDQAQSIEQALSKALPKELILSERASEVKACLVENESVFFVIRTMLAEGIHAFKDGQVLLRTWRPILPILFETELQLLNVKIDAFKHEGPIHAGLIKIFREYYTSILTIGHELIGAFMARPYDLSALEPGLNKVTQKLQEMTRGTLWSALKGAISVATAVIPDRTIMNEVKVVFHKDKRSSTPDFSYALRAVIKWFLSLPQQDLLPLLRPLISCSFAMMQWYEKLQFDFTEKVFEEGLAHLRLLVSTIQDICKRPMPDKSLLDLLLKVCKRFANSELTHTISLIISLIKDNQLSVLLELAVPFMRECWGLLAATDKNLEACYAALARCEQEWLKLYQKLRQPPYLIEKSIQEQIICFDAYMRRELKHQVDKKTKKNLSEAEQRRLFDEYKQQADRAVAWWLRPTDSCTPILNVDIEQHLKSALRKMVKALGIPDDDTFFIQLVQHYLGEMDVRLPLHESLQQIQKRYERLHALMMTLHTYKDQLKPLEFNHVVKILLNYYERGGRLEEGIQMLEWLLSYQDGRRDVLLQRLYDAMIHHLPLSTVAGREGVSVKLSYAIEGLKQAGLALARPTSEAERQAYYLQHFLDALTLHSFIAPDKIEHWKTILDVDWVALKSLIQHIAKCTEERLIEAILACLDAHIETFPAVVSCLNSVMQTPALQTFLLHLPREHHQARAWFGLIIAFSDQHLTTEEWETITHLLRTCPFDALQRFLQPFAYRPYPSKTKYLRLIRSTNEAYQTQLLAEMEDDPVWAAMPLMGEDDAPHPQRVESETRIDDAVSGVTSLLDPLMVSPELIREVSQQATRVMRWMTEYKKLSRADMVFKQRALQRSVKESDCSASSRAISETRLEWLALTSVMMSKTAGTTRGVLPNATQLIVVLLSWHTNGNGLFQLNTGEGKSFVSALLAAWEWLRLGTVDVMSANQGLVYQDYIEKGIRYFFALLQMPSRLLFSDKEHADQPGYISYTTPWDRAFVASRQLLTRYDGLAPTQPPALIKAACIADEGDVLLLKLLVTFDYVRSLHGENQFQWLYPMILDFIAQPAFRHLETTGGQSWGKKRDETELRRYIANQPLSALQRQQWDSVSSSDWQLSQWITAACLASQRLNALITSQEQRIGYHTAVPIVGDVPQVGAQFSHAVHCFFHVLLQRTLKDKRFEIPEEVAALDTNYPLGLVLRYERFIGLSATLGTRQDQLFLRQRLAMSSFTIQPHIPSRLQVLPPQLCQDDIAQSEAIVQQVARCGDGQPVLIIEDTQTQALLLSNRLQARFIEMGYTIQLVIGNEDAITKQSILRQTEMPYTATICTLLFARGLDLHPKHPKGLFTVMACLRDAESERQAWGRGGRFGQEGTACTILDATRYELLDLIGRDSVKQRKGLQEYQARLSQEAAVARYYTQEAALRRAGALAWFDQCVDFLLSVGQAEHQQKLSRQLLSFRQQWIEELVGIWDEVLAETDPDCLYANIYVRRDKKGLLDVAPLDAVLTNYPSHIQQAWAHFKQEMLKAVRPCLRAFDDDVHAVYQEKWLFEEQNMVEQLDLYQRSLRSCPSNDEGVTCQHHTGFGYREEQYRRVAPESKPTCVRKMGFFDSWQQRLAEQRVEIERLIQCLIHVETQPFPWRIELECFPSDLRQVIERIQRIDTMSCDDKTRSLHLLLDTALSRYQVMSDYTWQDFVDGKVNIVDYPVFESLKREFNSKRLNSSNSRGEQKEFEGRCDVLKSAFYKVQKEQCETLRGQVTEASQTARCEMIQQCRDMAMRLQRQLQEKLKQQACQLAEVATVKQTEAAYQSIDHVRVGRCVLV